MARDTDLDHLVAHLADRQHGAFTLRQLGGACDRRVASARVRRREWSRFLPGTFMLPGHLDDWSAPAAMCLHVPAAVVAGVAAGRWWDLPGLQPAPTRLLVPRSCGVRHTMLRTSDGLSAHEIRHEQHGWVRVTDPTRTLVDLGAVLDADHLERAVGSALRRRLTSVPRLRHRAVALKRSGRSGPSAVLAVLDRRPAGGGADSDGVLLLQLLRSAGVELPVRQHRLGPWRSDLAWPHQKVAIELDGDHHRSASQLRADGRKQNVAVVHGWTVLRFTWDRIAHEPEAVLAEVLAALS
jgi:hypothetical protein